MTVLQVGRGLTGIDVNKRSSPSPCDILGNTTENTTDLKKRKLMAMIQNYAGNNGNTSGNYTTNGKTSGGQSGSGSSGFGGTSCYYNWGSGAGGYGGSGGDDPGRRPVNAVPLHSHNESMSQAQLPSKLPAPSVHSVSGTGARSDTVSLTSVLLQARREMDLGVRHYHSTTRRHDNELSASNSSQDTIGSSGTTALGSPCRANLSSIMPSSTAQAILTRLAVGNRRPSPARTGTTTPNRKTTHNQFGEHTTTHVQASPIRAGTTTPLRSAQNQTGEYSTHTPAGNRLMQYRSYLSQQNGGYDSQSGVQQVLVSPGCSPGRVNENSVNPSQNKRKETQSKQFPMPWEFSQKSQIQQQQQNQQQQSQPILPQQRKQPQLYSQSQFNPSTPQRNSIYPEVNHRHHSLPAHRNSSATRNSSTPRVSATPRKYVQPSQHMTPFDEVIAAMSSSRNVSGTSRASPASSQSHSLSMKKSASPARMSGQAHSQAHYIQKYQQSQSFEKQDSNIISSMHKFQQSKTVDKQEPQYVNECERISRKDSITTSTMKAQPVIDKNPLLLNEDFFGIEEKEKEKEKLRRHSVGATTRPRHTDPRQNPLTSNLYSSLNHTSSESCLSQYNRSSMLSSFINSWSPKYHENLGAYREGGYLTVKIGEVFVDRYEVLHKLGWGEFSTVWLAYDRRPVGKNQSFVAIKVSKCSPQVIASTKYEINLLNYLREKNPKKESSCLVTLLDDFEHMGQYGIHYCMVMPLLGPNLLCIIDQMKARKRVRSEKEVQMVKDTVRATLQGLAELDSLNMVHTDLKPENILCSSLDNKTIRTIQTCIDKRKAEGGEALSIKAPHAVGDSCVRVADFGLSFLLEPNSTSCSLARKIGTRNLKVQNPGVAVNSGVLIQTREYRAPEVLFGHNFTARSDVWSVGCVVYELITGNFLFDPKRRTKVEKEMDIEHVAMIMQILGPVPTQVAMVPGRHMSNYFQEDGRFKHIERYRQYKMRSLRKELELFLAPSEAAACANFLHSCLSYTPNTRSSAAELLKSEWLK